MSSYPPTPTPVPTPAPTARPTPPPAPVRRERTCLITLLAILAVIAGINAFLDAARYMGWLPFLVNTPLGEIKFAVPQAQWLGAILAAIVGVIWFAVARQLWNLDPRGWLFIVVIAIFNLILLFLAVLGQTTFASVLPGILLSGAALIIALLPNTKAAFGMR